MSSKSVTRPCSSCWLFVTETCNRCGSGLCDICAKEDIVNGRYCRECLAEIREGYTVQKALQQCFE